MQVYCGSQGKIKTSRHILIKMQKHSLKDFNIAVSMKSLLLTLSRTQGTDCTYKPIILDIWQMLENSGQGSFWFANLDTIARLKVGISSLFPPSLQFCILFLCV